MTVAVAGTVGRAAATRAAAGAGSRAGAGRVIEGRVVGSRASSSASSSARGKGSGLAGDLLGGLAQGSAISRGLRSPAKQAAGPGSPARRLLVAEFALCLVLVALSPVTDAKRTESPAAWMKRASAVMAAFFVLGLVSTAGRGAGRAAAGFGGLITLGLAISSRSIFTVLAGKIGTSAGESSGDGEGSIDGIGDAIGDAVGGAIDAGADALQPGGPAGVGSAIPPGVHP